MDFQNIKELIRIFDKSDLTKLQIKENEFKISLQKGFEGGTVTYATPATQIVSTQAPVVTSNAEVVEVVAPVALAPKDLTLNAPMVGTFYKSPSPSVPAFVKDGDVIKKGQAVCILEAMKIMNEVEVEFDCKIIRCLVDDSSPVEYDMPLFEIERV